MAFFQRKANAERPSTKEALEQQNKWLDWLVIHVQHVVFSLEWNTNYSSLRPYNNGLSAGAAPEILKGEGTN